MSHRIPSLERMSRRRWLTLCAGSLIALPILQSCRISSLFSSSPPSGPDDFVLIFGTRKHPDRPDHSLLLIADTETEKVSTVELPIKNAHVAFLDRGDVRNFWVSGLECGTVAKVDVRKLSVTGTAQIGEGNMGSGGHIGPIYRGGETFVLSPEYEPGVQKPGRFTIRRPADLSIIAKRSSEGNFPHGSTYLPATDEIVIQNIGQNSEDEYYAPKSELVFFNRATLNVSRRIHPGKTGAQRKFAESRTGSDSDTVRFRDLASKLYDFRNLLARDPEFWIEHRDYHSVTRWNRETGEMKEEIKIQAPEIPIHVHSMFGPNIIVALRGGGLVFLPKSNPSQGIRPPAFANFNTDAHIMVVSKKTFA